MIKLVIIGTKKMMC